VQSESRRLHLRSIAEYQAYMLDLFLTERIQNLTNLIDDPRLELPPSSASMQTLLGHLKKDSDIFVDVGFFDSSGIQTAYDGPFPYLEHRDYSHEHWFITLRSSPNDFVITDVYLGFRQNPHFTIAVRRTIDGRYCVLRSTLDPEKFYQYIESLKGSDDVNISIINLKGAYQLVTQAVGAPLNPSSLAPPRTPRLGEGTASREGGKSAFAYAWLNSADWAVIVQRTQAGTPSFLVGGFISFAIFSIALILLVLSIILFRSKRLVQMQIERETATAQFEHAAKLASIGELSAGIAHEINNPLAVISEEVGLMKDLMNPEFKQKVTFDDLQSHLDDVQEAVFRCRDITRKLLSFVRKADIQLKSHHVNELMDEVLDGFWLHELAVSNIELVKNYGSDLPGIITDANQITQVFLNILNNAADAIKPPGRITISTSCNGGNLQIAIADTGKGITPEQMGKIFLPFYTTKEVGKGTGLGLSVSYSIVKSFGGDILVESISGKGSVFTVVLPVK
jgi:two-component system NtrC family sensor kinase